MKFTLMDQSTEPFAWMIDGVSAKDMRAYGVRQWVDDVSLSSIEGTASEDDDVGDILRKWRDETDEFEEAIKFLTQWVNE